MTSVVVDSESCGDGQCVLWWWTELVSAVVVAVSAVVVDRECHGCRE